MNQYAKSSGYITTQQIGNNPTYKLSGASTAANETGFEVIGMGGVSLDAGISTYGTEYIFITHAHLDHIKNITSTILNCESDKKRTSPLKIYCPRGSYEYIKKKIESDYFATKHNKQHDNCLWVLIGVSPTDSIEIFTAGKKYIVTAIQCTHSIACTGYGFTEIRNKVKISHLEKIEQLTRLEKIEYFDAMESQGIDCYEQQLIPLFVYLGDTTHKVFELEYEKIFIYPTIIVECTFIKPEEIKKAKNDKHMHWDNLKPIIQDHQTTQFILYHFSARYDHEIIKDFFDRENMINVIPFINFGISISNLCKNIHDALCKCIDIVKCETYKLIIEQQNIAKGIQQISCPESLQNFKSTSSASYNSTASLPTSVFSSDNLGKDKSYSPSISPYTQPTDDSILPSIKGKIPLSSTNLSLNIDNCVEKNI
jgi:ribonuclease Z